MDGARWVLPRKPVLGARVPGRVNGLTLKKPLQAKGKITPPPRKRGDAFVGAGFATYIAAFLTPSFFSVHIVVALTLAVSGILLILLGFRRFWEAEGTAR